MRTIEGIFFEMIDTLVAEIRKSQSNIDTVAFQARIDALKLEMIEASGIQAVNLTTEAVAVNPVSSV